jgi:hypothetical protein
MDRREVESSQLKSVGYDAEKRILEIEFKGGGVYQYFDVPAETHKALMEAESMGKYFGKEIRSKFKFAKLPPPEKAEGATP